MRVKILDVDRNLQSDVHLVNFECEYGQANGYWYGNTPQVKHEYYVEVEIRDSLIWNENIFTIDTAQFSIMMDGKNVASIQGLLEITDDGFCTILVDTFYIVCEICNAPKPISVFVRIISPKLAFSEYLLIS